MLHIYDFWPGDEKWMRKPSRCALPNKGRRDSSVVRTVETENAQSTSVSVTEMDWAIQISAWI